MNPTGFIIGAALLTTGAFAQTDLSKAVPPTPAKPTVSGTLTAVTPAAPTKTTSTPGKTSPDDVPKPLTFDPAVPTPASVVPKSADTARPVTNAWTPVISTNWTRTPPSPWDAKSPPNPWRTGPAPRDPWK
jgi:hypothetical protein